MKDLIQIHYDNADRPTVSGRELHEALGVETRYNDWFDRMCEYGFSAGKDYYSFLSNRSDGKAGKPRTDHQLTIPMQRNSACSSGRTRESRCSSTSLPWKNSGTALMRSCKSLAAVERQAERDADHVSALTVENQIMKPKAEYFDELVDRNLLTGIRETAGELGVKQNQFVAFLLEKKYMYRDKKGKLTAYAKPLSDGLFERKECVNEKTQWKGTQDLVTLKGRETFRLLMVGA